MRTAAPAIPALAAITLLTAPLQAQSERSTHYLTKQCNEDAIALRVDPAPLQKIVGPDFSLLIEQGKARILVVAHDCAQYWMDGEEVGPTQDTQVWALIRGTGDVRPLVGAEQTLPTRTWFNLFSGSNNPHVRRAKGASGTQQAPIQGILLEPAGRAGVDG